jgi:hypothetical protein
VCVVPFQAIPPLTKAGTRSNVGHLVHQQDSLEPLTTNLERIKSQGTNAFVTTSHAMPVFSRELRVSLDELMAGKTAKAESIVGEVAGKVSPVVVLEESLELGLCHWATSNRAKLVQTTDLCYTLPRAKPAPDVRFGAVTKTWGRRPGGGGPKVCY